ncbi:YggT family protein [Pasteurella langaaensis DSM 22999]|uniref:YggT family protein n=1 Tax=Alitibacter langaaensis DSM 22999 TaxID=1122935 RepID=A0A2U0TCP1_9PAST|nr:YggT family protein [Pasteurella langaaensis]PVX41405.1 YggT family protein [Pasteurella langaaensis DSM 22999]
MTGFNSLQYLVFTIINLYCMLVMLRMWLQYSKADFYNQISQAVVKLTDPVLVPLRKTFKPVKGVDIASLIFVFVLGMVKVPLMWILAGEWTFEAITSNLFQIVIIGGLTIVSSFGQMILYVIFIGAILSWFRRGNDPLSYLLYQLGEPLLSPIRRILPKTGMIDFSPMILAFALFWLNRVMYDIFAHLWVWA